MCRLKFFNFSTIIHLLKPYGKHNLRLAVSFLTKKALQLRRKISRIFNHKKATIERRLNSMSETHLSCQSFVLNPSFCGPLAFTDVLPDVGMPEEDVSGVHKRPLREISGKDSKHPLAPMENPLTTLAMVASEFSLEQTTPVQRKAPSARLFPPSTTQTAVRAVISRHCQMARAALIARALIARKNPPNALEVCEIHIGREHSDVVDRTVSVFKAYVPGIEQSVGKCSFEIIDGFSDCDDVTYASKKVVGVLNLDSSHRKIFRGIGTLLMKAAIEHGLVHGTEGRIALHSTGEALGFYYKLGMRNGHRDAEIDQRIKTEIDQAAKESREPKDILDGDALIMYLPPEAIATWKRSIQSNPVFQKPI